MYKLILVNDVYKFYIVVLIEEINWLFDERFYFLRFFYFDRDSNFFYVYFVMGVYFLVV